MAPLNRCSAAPYNSVYSLNVHKSTKTSEFQLATKSIMWFNIPDVNREWVPRSRSCNSKRAVLQCPCTSNSEITTCRWSETVIVALATQDGQDGTRAPCHCEHQTSRRTVCTLCACEPVTSVSGVALVQHGCKQISRASVSWIRRILLHNATLQFASSPLQQSRRMVVNASTSSCNDESSVNRLIICQMCRRW